MSKIGKNSDASCVYCRHFCSIRSPNTCQMKSSVVVVVVLAMCCALPATRISAQDKKEARYFMDVHKLEPGGVSYGDVLGAHELDLKTQGKRGVSFVTFWVDEEQGYVYCLSRAKDYSDVHDTHEEAHGLVPEAIYEVIAGEQEQYTGNGFLFLDIHDLGPGNVKAADVTEAHKLDLAKQDEYKVNFINYWVDEKQGKVFCLSEAPNREAVIATHKHAHGLVPAQVLTVKQGQ